MQAVSDQASAPTVLVVGPPPTMVGGMSSVVSHILSLDFGGRYHVACFPITLSPTGGERFARRVRRHLRRLGLLRGTIRRTRARILHIHICSGFSFYRSVVDMVVARAMGCRVVLHVHGAAFDTFHAEATRMRRRLIAWSLTQADRVVALSAGWRETLQRMAPRARIAVLENAVATDTVPPERHHGEPCRFLLLARMDEWKGIDDLLDACATLHAEGTHFELVLAGPAGTAGNKTALDAKIRTRRLQRMVRYVGLVRGEEKSNLLNRADVYLQPSHHEGMPIALLEALAQGLPIVATKVGAVPEVIEDQRHGLLVSPHEPAQLARAMGILASDGALRKRLGRGAFALAAERFSLRRFRDDLLSLYDAVLF